MRYQLKSPWRIGASLRPEWPIDGDHVLTMDVHHIDGRRYVFAYELTHKGYTIFAGQDFSAPWFGEVDTITGDDMIEYGRSLLGFLTLRPGDTDYEYFDNYSLEQLDWVDLYAEQLSIYAMED